MDGWTFIAWTLFIIFVFAPNPKQKPLTFGIGIFLAIVCIIIGVSAIVSEHM